jgi:Domain of unknown function (DUF3786)
VNKLISGEEKAWEMILDLDPVDVCRRANVTYNRDTASYLLKSFGFEFSISPRGREIKNLSEKGKLLATRLAYFFKHSVLSYLLNAKEIPLTERLIKPENIRGGEFFFQGSHTLPLDKVAEKYGNDKEGFLTRRKELSGRLLGHGDASFELLPLPRVPVTLILWLTDEEFPARLDILFDSTCEIQVPLDIVWSIGMMSIMALL